MYAFTAFLKLIFAFLALLMGMSIILGVCYNEFIQILPKYERPPFLGTFGIVPVMIAVGSYWARGALKELRGRQFNGTDRVNTRGTGIGH
jgi:hypothetical protein